jgi:hypothetical protein
MGENGFFEIQSRLIQKLRDLLPPHLSLAQELPEILGISTDSAYRRIRCESALSIDEIEKICRKFRISFDSLLLHESNVASFNYAPIRKGTDLIRYLTAIRDDMAKIKQTPNSSITYASVDVPIFHIFKHPEYFHFKMFYWLHSIARDPDYMDRKFSVHGLDEALTTVAREMLDLYAQIPSTELWSESVLNSTIKQIEYLWLAGVFNDKSDALVLCQKIYESLLLVQKEAELNIKYLSDGSPSTLSPIYHLYHTDIEIGNNTILVSLGSNYVVYNTFHTFNRMYTTHHDFCIQTELWLNNLKKQANLISGVAQKQRYQFFRKIFNSIDQLRELIEKA